MEYKRILVFVLEALFLIIGSTAIQSPAVNSV